MPDDLAQLRANLLRNLRNIFVPIAIFFVLMVAAGLGLFGETAQTIALAFFERPVP